MRGADHWATEADLSPRWPSADSGDTTQMPQEVRPGPGDLNEAIRDCRTKKGGQRCTGRLNPPAHGDVSPDMAVGAAERAENHRGRRLCSDKVAAPTTLNDTSEKSETAASSR